jgi:pimeloyl-ACP methyl ester carboxylesterase
LAAAALCWSSAVARADFGACQSAQSVPTTCETLTVPLDRSGGVAGDVHLLVERRAASGPSKGTLVVLAGGPGQAATPLIDGLQHALAPALRNRDLVVFDQRGTGGSDRLNCPALDTAGTFTALDSAVEACANSLGPRRAFYTSRDSADDIEAIRRSIGVDKISLYGVSYGTFTALTYARRYPDHVESLALDSVINPAGRDALDRSTYAAFPRVLRDICAGGCRGITSDPVADLNTLVGRVQRQPLKVVAYSPAGSRLRGTLGEEDIVNMLEGADFDPIARAELPAALVSARRGDGAPLARLLLRENAGAGTRAAFASTPVSDSQALFFATACEEIPFPWSRTAPLSDRAAQLAAALSGLPASTYAPFSRQTEANAGTSRPCRRWPDGSPDSPLVSGPAPDVPVLLLEGVDDTRTPIADAQATAALFPRASLVTVPETGHSVVGTDFSNCSQTALADFFASFSARPCAATARLFPPTKIAPTSIAGLRPPKGVGGKRGKTVAAVAATLSDTVLQEVARGSLGNSLDAGGLRGGHSRGLLFGTLLTVRLTRVVFVPGVTVSGTVLVDLASAGPPSASVTVSGRAAAKGSLDFSGGRFRGRLDGRAVKSHAGAAAAAFVPRRIPAETLLRLRRSAGLRHAARLP